MAKIDPNDPQYETSGNIIPRVQKSGTYDFAAYAFDRKTINGKDCIEVRSVVVTPGSDQLGAVLIDLFYMHSTQAISRFVSFAKGVGWNEPFDPDDDGDVMKLIQNAPFRATVDARKDGKYWRHECQWTYVATTLERDPTSGRYQLTPTARDGMVAAKKDWDEYKAKAPARGSGFASAKTGNDHGAYRDNDEIPF